MSHPRVPDGFEKYITYFTSDTDKSNHIVREERETEVVTACGRTLRKAGHFSRTRGGYVSDIHEDTQFGNYTCGSCPFNEEED